MSLQMIAKMHATAPYTVEIWTKGVGAAARFNVLSAVVHEDFFFLPHHPKPHSLIDKIRESDSVLFTLTPEGIGT